MTLKDLPELTEDRIASIAAELEVLDPHDRVWVDFARAVEAELGARSTVDMGSLAEQASSWSAVWGLLRERDPDLTKRASTGLDCALASIRKMSAARSTAAQPAEPTWIQSAALALIEKNNALLSEIEAQHAAASGDSTPPSEPVQGDPSGALRPEPEPAGQGSVEGDVRVLRQMFADCDVYLKDGETPAQRIERERRDTEAVLNLLIREKQRTEAMREVMLRMMAGIDHLAEIARQWEPDHSSGADRRGWVLAKDARDDAARLLQPEPQAAPDARTLAEHIERRLRTWRQQQMNRSGDRLALDDFMGDDSIDDLVDFVCDEYAMPAPKPLTAQQLDKLIEAHVGGAELADGEYSAMVMFAAAVERAHGIGA